MGLVKCSCTNVLVDTARDCLAVVGLNTLHRHYCWFLIPTWSIPSFLTGVWGFASAGCSCMCFSFHFTLLVTLLCRTSSLHRFARWLLFECWPVLFLPTHVSSRSPLLFFLLYSVHIARFTCYLGRVATFLVSSRARLNHLLSALFLPFHDYWLVLKIAR